MADKEESAETTANSCQCTYYAKLLLFVLVTWIVYSYVIKRIIKNMHSKFLAKAIAGLSELYGKAMMKRKQALFSKLNDLKRDGQPLKVLEIGAGSGVNFQYFPKGTEVTCIEPNDHFESYLRSNLERTGSHVTLAGFEVCQAEDMSRISSASVDAVVCTLVMCSVNDLDSVLREIRRVLKPGGKFFFLEHVAGDADSWTLTIQGLIRLPWLWLLECNLVRTTHVNIHAAGFSSVDLELFWAAELDFGSSRVVSFIQQIIAPHMIGTATK